MDPYSSPKNSPYHSPLILPSTSLLTQPMPFPLNRLSHLLGQRANTQNASFELFTAANLHYQPS